MNVSSAYKLYSELRSTSSAPWDSWQADFPIEDVLVTQARDPTPLAHFPPVWRAAPMNKVAEGAAAWCRCHRQIGFPTTMALSRG